MKKIVCSQMRVLSAAEIQHIHGGTAQRTQRLYGGCVGGASSSQGNSGGGSSGHGCVGGAQSAANGRRN